MVGCRESNPSCCDRSQVAGVLPMSYTHPFAFSSVCFFFYASQWLPAVEIIKGKPLTSLAMSMARRVGAALLKVVYSWLILTTRLGLVRRFAFSRNLPCDVSLNSSLGDLRIPGFSGCRVRHFYRPFRLSSLHAGLRTLDRKSSELLPPTYKTESQFRLRT